MTTAMAAMPRTASMKTKRGSGAASGNVASTAGDCALFASAIGATGAAKMLVKPNMIGCELLDGGDGRLGRGTFCQRPGHWRADAVAGDLSIQRQQRRGDGGHGVARLHQLSPTRSHFLAERVM